MKRITLQNAGVSGAPVFTKTPEGYLAGEMGLMRPGVLDYTFAELDLPYGEFGKGPNDTVGVYFPESVVFDQRTKTSAEMKPVTLGHPGEVNADNYRDFAVGHIGSGLEDKDGVLTAKYVIRDSNAIREIENGKQETSIRFDVPLTLDPGEADGKKYLFRAEDYLNVNHTGLLNEGEGRAGPSVRINNSNGGLVMPDKTEQGGASTININLNNGNPAPESTEGTPAPAPAAAPAPAPASNPPADPPQQNLSEDEINRRANRRAYILANAAPLLPEGEKPEDKSNLDILKAALKDIIVDGQEYTEDRLIGMLEVVVQNRGKATEAQRKLLQNNDGTQPGNAPPPQGRDAVSAARAEFIQYQQDGYKSSQREADPRRR